MSTAQPAPLASTPTATELAISEPLSWEQICARYPDQWVCLVEIDRIRPNDFDFRTARVVGHGTTRREPLAQARPWWSRYDEIAHYYTGVLVAPPLRFAP